jgi:hypothetical protein
VDRRQQVDSNRGFEQDEPVRHCRELKCLAQCPRHCVAVSAVSPELQPASAAARRAQSASAGSSERAATVDVIAWRGITTGTRSGGATGTRTSVHGATALRPRLSPIKVHSTLSTHHVPACTDRTHGFYIRFLIEFGRRYDTKTQTGMTMTCRV